MKGYNYFPENNFKKGVHPETEFEKGIIPWNKKSVKRTCLTCGKVFYVPPSRVKRGAGKYCSLECHHEARRGDTPWNKGLTKETDERVKRQGCRGENHHLYEKNPWNKNTKGLCKPNETSYKTGHKNPPEIERKRIKNSCERPTKPESELMKLIEEHNLPYRYVGNGEVLIGGKNPDFISTDGTKRVIEVFGRVFHDPDRAKKAFGAEIYFHQTYKGSIEHYEKQGYSCIPIWDDELKDEEAVIKKITWKTPEFIKKTSHFYTTIWGWAVSYPENLRLGLNVDVGFSAYIQAEEGVTLEDDVQIGGGCKIYSVDTISGTRGKVVIKRGACVGANSVVLPGVTIGENTVVGALSLVKEDVPTGEVWAGVPVRRIRARLRV